MRGKARSYICLGKDGGGCDCTFVFCPDAAPPYSRVKKVAEKEEEEEEEEEVEGEEEEGVEEEEGGEEEVEGGSVASPSSRRVSLVATWQRRTLHYRAKA